MKKLVFIILAVAAIALNLIFVMSKKEQKPTTVIIKENKKTINVSAICQYPELPTGCESVAAAMVLQYYGQNVTAQEFASEWLTCSEKFYKSNNDLYGPDPNEVFVGNPFSENSYGCYASVIVKAINENSAECKAQKITNKSLSQLCDEYINNNKPVLIWATMGMKESKSGKSWYLPNGEKFTWTAGEHCLVLIGYSDEYYFLNDPQSGSTVAYPKSIVEKRFKELGSQAVYIYKVSADYILNLPNGLE